MTNKLIQWPNKLGYDIGETEIWCYEDSFGVYGPRKVLSVPYSVTTDPMKAFALCQIHGLLRSKLDDMEFALANAAYYESYKLLALY